MKITDKPNADLTITIPKAAWIEQYKQVMHIATTGYAIREWMRNIGFDFRRHPDKRYSKTLSVTVVATDGHRIGSSEFLADCKNIDELFEETDCIRIAVPATFIAGHQAIMRFISKRDGNDISKLVFSHKQGEQQVVKGVTKQMQLKAFVGDPKFWINQGDVLFDQYVHGSLEDSKSHKFHAVLLRERIVEAAKQHKVKTSSHADSHIEIDVAKGTAFIGQGQTGEKAADIVTDDLFSTDQCTIDQPFRVDTHYLLSALRTFDKTHCVGTFHTDSILGKTGLTITGFGGRQSIMLLRNV